MTTTFPATSLPGPVPSPGSAALPTPTPVAARVPASVPAPARVALSACPVERDALATAARDLADALTGIAFDAPCRAARQRAVVEFSAGVLRAAQGVATRTGHVSLHRACRAAELAAPQFARDVSAGAPAMAGAWTALADLFEAAAQAGARAGSGHDHSGEGLLACERRFRAACGQAAFGVPWFAATCSAGERVVLARSAPLRVRVVLRLAEDRWLDRRDAVRG